MVCLHKYSQQDLPTSSGNVCLYQLQYNNRERCFRNPCTTSGLSHPWWLDKSISNLRGVCFFFISNRNFFEKTVKTLIRRCVLRCLVWAYNVCIDTIYGTLGTYGLNHKYEPQHDKTNKMACVPSENICPVWSGWRKLGSLATHWAHSENSDQTGWSES